MARVTVLLVAALVLCTAAAMAHAGRVIQEEARGSGGLEASSWLLPPAEAPSPYAGGVEPRGGGSTGGYGNVVVDVLWFVLKWANDAYAAAGRRKVQ
ncbi:hypothetical protein ZWY2020_001104 [Hordeum vulgare]|nr:hypothetical protein ZWY2020_001104 [Hordeum vulgare]